MAASKPRMKLTAEQRDEADSLWTYKASFAGFFFVLAAAAIPFSLVSFTSDDDGSCTRLSASLTVHDDYRVGSGIEPSTSPSWYWASAKIGSVGTVNFALLAAIAPAAEFLWLLVALYFHEREIAMIFNDHNPFRWWRYGWSHGLAFLVMALVGTVGNVWLLVWLVAGVITWIVYFSNTERFNSVAINAQRFKRAAEEEKSTWVVYDDFLYALGVFVLVAVTIFWHLGVANSLAAYNAEGVGLPLVAWFVSIGGAVIYLGLPLILFLHHKQLMLESVYDKERALFWWQFVFITYVVVATLLFCLQIPC